MRALKRWVSVIAMWLSTSVCFAQPVKRDATIDIDDVELRAGISLKLPAVGKLRKGDRILVLREEETGFYAIQPPPGSVSWIKQIHLGKVELGENGRANVPVLVKGAEILAGSTVAEGPKNCITTQVPEGTIVEVIGIALRVDNTNWFPIVPPDGDLRWIPKWAVKGGAVAVLPSPKPYERPDVPALTVSNDGSGKTASGEVVKPASLPRELGDHRLLTQAAQAEKTGDYATAKALYGRIYQDLWDQKADREALLICYSRFQRCDDALKRGDSRPAPPPTRSAPVTPSEPEKKTLPAGQWTKTGYLQELQKVFVDGQQVYALQDEGGKTAYYVTGAPGINLKNYNGRRVQLFGVVTKRPELYLPHLSVEQVEVAK